MLKRVRKASTGQLWSLPKVICGIHIAVVIKSFRRIVGNVKHGHEGHTGYIKANIKISTKTKQYLQNQQCGPYTDYTKIYEFISL